MPNYNQTLQNNNSSLEEIITKINELPDSGEGGLDTNDATATSGDILNGKTAYVKGEKITGNIAFQPAQTITPTTSDQIIASNIYLGGAQTIKGDVNLVADNIVSGKSIFGVVGTATAGGGGDISVEDGLINGFISGTYINNRVTNIRSAAFYRISNLTSVNFPAVQTIQREAFFECSKLTSISFPVATSIDLAAFEKCSNLTSINFPKVTTIGSSAFRTCKNLTSISFPMAAIISSGAFNGCSGLISVNFPKVTTIPQYAFENCTSLISANFPLVTTIGTEAFSTCSKLTSISFPKLITIGERAFAYCRNLTSVNFLAVTTISGAAFSYCSNLTSVSFPKATIIYNNAFNKCFNLTALYLTNSVVCTLSHSNAFSSTPIGGYSTSAGTYGSIYVPMSLVDAYKSATNWTFFSSRIFGI